MRNVPPDKYNVAWFKLAECVSRGEKERALGVYRLLAHSLQDSAFARQLQGDILISFHDHVGAIEHYKSAAQLYKKDGRFLEAAALYEHILALVADKREVLAALLELYSMVRNRKKVTAHAAALFNLLLEANNIDEALRIMHNLDALLTIAESIFIRQSLVIALMQKRVAHATIMDQAEKAVEQFLALQDTQALQRFLAMVETFDMHCYERLLERI